MEHLILRCDIPIIIFIIFISTTGWRPPSFHVQWKWFKSWWHPWQRRNIQWVLLEDSWNAVSHMVYWKRYRYYLSIYWVPNEAKCRVIYVFSKFWYSVSFNVDRAPWRFVLVPSDNRDHFVFMDFNQDGLVSYSEFFSVHRVIDYLR